ncbi:uncharacterized protein MELLADRAFT_115059 [Melampsora larici-populina 98AG31]|uniref:CxC5 like cysteine cluster associated with KDZ domain-containing protein n=1 Tax=Melampsora larici-populina (strain 98AG31 / pathotype 3-4-7) TaxID=747676 RepID=F4R6Y2_MELLP|nr:uncharacterized protein MELLADRAFT_115059 [Melampsora larici-populina 98AG31]EGG11951.1 hypothetical protein MELLADRAFT_115059 [Melampsora larici-populina 98AG31]
MLLRDFTLELITQYPHLSATLTVGDFVCFATLAAEVEHVAGESLRLSPARFPFAPFFDTALSVPTAHNQMQELWRLSYPVLRECRINPQALIRDFGVQQQTTQLPERFLRSPLTKCIICTPNHSYALHVHSRINGYLHDLDGVHTVQTVTLNCSNPACETMYKPSFYTRGAERYYYTPDMGRNKDYLHIHCHYYMSSRLAYTFRVLQMLGQYHISTSSIGSTQSL